MNLSDVLHEAVDGIEPADRIDEIRARTTTSARSAARPWFLAAGATVLATAATVAGFAILDSSPPPHDHGAMVMPAPAESQLVAAYYVGDTPYGPRLFREFDEVPGSDRLQAALDRIERPATDPDYRTSWTTASFDDVTIDDDSIDVDLGDAVLSDPLAVQQVVYTLQAAAGERLPVWFWRDGQRGNAPYTAEPENDVLSQVSISDPAQGNEYEGSFTARGRANSFEGTVVWEIHGSGPHGGVVLREGSAMAEGSVDRLYPWSAEIDLTGLDPGTYTFVAKTDDPTGEGPGPYTDTRTITVR